MDLIEISTKRLVLEKLSNCHFYLIVMCCLDLFCFFDFVCGFVKKQKKGVYFALNAECSINYCKSNNGKYCMLACRVLIGETANGKEDCEAPLKADGHTRVETLVDDVQYPTIFVATRDYVALPVYYIWFHLSKVSSQIGY